MKYVIWAVRFWYAAWMIPAGLEHFYHIYPQPGANSSHPIAAEMLAALLNTHLFDLVKAVELITGLAVLFGFFSPLALLMCMPVAFCVFWWDSPLSDWNTSSVIAGARVLASNVFLCIAYVVSFRAMFTPRATVASRTGALGNAQFVLILRVVFGAWMVLNGLNAFVFPLWPAPMGHTALSSQLMTALVHSRLLDVCLFIELIAGALILVGWFVPAALCTLMAISTCGLFWAVLDHQPATLALGLLAFGLNALLMLAYLRYYDGALQRAPLTLGETDRRSDYNTLFVYPAGRTSRANFVFALIPLTLAVVWYTYRGSAIYYAPWGVLVLLYPAVVLYVRRLHDMGRSGWWMLVPTLLAVVAMGIWAQRITLGPQVDAAIPVAALVAFVGAALWGCLDKGQTAANSFGPPIAA